MITPALKLIFFEFHGDLFTFSSGPDGVVFQRNHVTRLSTDLFQVLSLHPFLSRLAKSSNIEWYVEAGPARFTSLRVIALTAAVLADESPLRTFSSFLPKAYFGCAAFLNRTGHLPGQCIIIERASISDFYIGIVHVVLATQRGWSLALEYEGCLTSDEVEQLLSQVPENGLVINKDFNCARLDHAKIVTFSEALHCVDDLLMEGIMKTIIESKIEPSPFRPPALNYLRLSDAKKNSKDKIEITRR